MSPAGICLAPEADGNLDVEERDGLLDYRLYIRPFPQYVPSGWPQRNVFKIWMNTCPRAVEKAEVFSLGKTMWMLLEGVSGVEAAALLMEDIYWTRDNILDKWKVMVSKCTNWDPNERPGLLELEEFYKGVRYWMARDQF